MTGFRITDAQAQAAFDVLHSDEAPKARAAHEWLQETRKTVQARLLSQSNLKTVGEREAWAYQHPDYIAHLAEQRKAAEADYSARQRVDAAKAVLDAWRTQAASDRELARVR